MNKPFIPVSLRASLFFLAISISGQLMAEEIEGLEVPKLPGEAYITPDQMTSEDRMLLSEYSGDYNACLMDVSARQMQPQADVRHVVDYAMKECAVKLEELNEKMTARNFEPNFRQGYIHMVSTKGANNALRNVMIDMAARPAAPEPATGSDQP